MELECVQPWNEQQDLPMMFAPRSAAILKLPAQWQPEGTPAKGLQATDHAGIWRITAELQQLQPCRVKLTSLALGSPQPQVQALRQLRPHEYVTTLPEHTDPVHLTLPSQALLVSNSSGDASSSGSVVTFPPSTAPCLFQLTYRLPIESSWGITSWQPHTSSGASQPRPKC